MSCITELLKLKGDKPLLFYPTKKPRIAIEGGGTYKGYEFLITFSDRGHRCGYVALPPNHPEAKKSWDSCNIECHGGVTFYDSDSPLKELLGEHHCNDIWVGFDCMHLHDIPCMNTVIAYFGETNEYVKFKKNNPWEEDFVTEISSHKTFSYVEKECKSIIRQLKRLEI